MLQDILSLLISCVEQLIASRNDVYVVVVAVILAVMLWVFAAYYTKLWNKAFRNKPIHYFLFTLAGVATFCFVIIFYSLKFTEFVASGMVIKWSNELQNDSKWRQDVFVKAYEAVEKSGKADMTSFKHPDEGGHLIPSPPEVRSLSAGLYAHESIKHFKNNHPLLSKILWARSAVTIEKIKVSMNTFFEENQGDNYVLSDAVQIAAKQIGSELKEQTPKVVYTTRVLIFLLFLCFQLIAFGIVGLHAYKSLKVKI